MKHFLFIILFLCTFAQATMPNITDSKPRPADCPLSKGSTNFVVHYQNNDQLSNVDIILSAAEYALEKESIELGWPLPLRDGLLGGDDRYDIYLKGIGDYYGMNYKDVNQASRHILVSKDLNIMKIILR